VPLLGTCGLQRTCRVKRMRRARSPALTSAATLTPARPAGTARAPLSPRTRLKTPACIAPCRLARGEAEAWHH
jgi:hypothetical protein